MCLLRGQIHLRLSSTQLAKECFLEALSLDVRCYDAFVALVGGEMMGVEEGQPINDLASTSSQLKRPSSSEWDTIQGLCYQDQTEECADFIRMMYTVRLKKVRARVDLFIRSRS